MSEREGGFYPASSSIPWRQVMATRNRLIHGYLGIDNDILWSIIQDDIPMLLQDLKKLKGESWLTNGRCP